MLNLSYPAVMGVINVTPDSFSDGGLHLHADTAIARAHAMAEAGAAIIDIGGESTRPGAPAVDAQKELDRIMPVLESLARDLTVPISVDTSKPAVMAQALRAGAAMINDTHALQAPGALELLAQSKASVCLMHMQGTPQTMQHNPHYDDVVEEVKGFLRQRIDACEAMGIRRERISVDPGFGFGKSLKHNLTLLKHLDDFHELGVPLLVGLSRKSMIGKLTDAPMVERLPGSLAAAVIALWQGAHIVRVHDVKATVQALRVCHSVKNAD